MLKHQAIEKTMTSLTRRQVCPGGIFVATMSNFTRASSVERIFEMLIFSNPVKGRDAEFNAWYDEQRNPGTDL